MRDWCALLKEVCINLFNLDRKNIYDVIKALFNHPASYKPYYYILYSISVLHITLNFVKLKDKALFQGRRNVWILGGNSGGSNPGTTDYILANWIDRNRNISSFVCNSSWWWNWILAVRACQKYWLFCVGTPLQLILPREWDNFYDVQMS